MAIIYAKCEGCGADVEFTHGDHPSQHLHVFCDACKIENAETDGAGYPEA